MFEARTKLPVWQYKDNFLKLLDENQTLVLVGQTGSGKTTQIPQMCVEYCKRKKFYSTSNGNGKPKFRVACTQPRRVAAMSVASRVAKEMQIKLGQEVGYSVRFDSCSDPSHTQLKYITDGMLLREAMLDGYLRDYSIIILDEAHERTLQTEILFGIIKRALKERNKPNSSLPQLKVIAMSATINVKLFKKYLNSSVLHIEGRQHAVQDMFAELHQSDLLTSTLITVFQIHRTQDEGDILVFCAGQDEIQSLMVLCKKVLKQAPDSLKQLEVLPLYAALPVNHQMRVFDRPIVKKKVISNTNGTSGVHPTTSSVISRRVVFATNVAETSVTIPNIKYVIDTGKVKCRSYCPRTGLESLKVVPISKAQADQRSGRAGRTSEGTCYRLYTTEEFCSMPNHQPPEIKRCNMDSVVLQMISIGVKNINTFDYLEKPDEDRLASALTSLLSLRAIKRATEVTNSSSDKDTTTNSQTQKVVSNGESSQVSSTGHILNLDFELTSLGKKLSTFPLNPQMSRILLAANELGCLDEALTVISLLSIESLFYIPPNRQAQADAMLEKFHTNEGDTVMLLKVYKAFKKTSIINRSGLRIWCAEHFIHAKNLRLSRLIRKQLSDLCKSMGMRSSSCGQDTSILRHALTYGLYNNVATMWNGKYRNKYSDGFCIHPSSCLFKSKPETLMYLEVVETNKCYMRSCTLVDMNWVRQIDRVKEST